jgi:hypothetical protein
MRGKTAFVLAMMAASNVVATSSTGWAQYNYNRKGGFVKPCSLDGVNPVYHPEIFGNPAVARTYGFFLGPDRRWHVVPNCRAY